MAIRIAVSGLGIVAALAVSGLAASPALALPIVALTLGGAYPVSIKESSTAKGTLGTAAGVTLEAEGGTVLGTFKEATSLGEGTLILTNVGNSKEKCHTSGDATGVVLVSGTGHLVRTPAGLGGLLEGKETEIICAKLEVLVKGSIIGLIHAGIESEELTKGGGIIKGTKGKQELTEYFNDGGTIVKTQLLSNAGAGFVLSDVNISEELTGTVPEGKMITITGR